MSSGLRIGYFYSIRSERRLCQEVALNLAYRWFRRLGLEDEVPDHSTFSVNRHGRVRESFDLNPQRVAGDVAYGTGMLLGWLRRQDIEPHIPVLDKSKRDDGTLSREAFTFDKDGDVYVCPQGKSLKTTGKHHDGKTLLYRARKADCDPCLVATNSC